MALFGQALTLVPEDQPELRRAIAIRRAETQVGQGDPGAAAALDKLLEETGGLERLKVLTTRAHTAHWALDAEGATRMSQEAFHLASPCRPRSSSDRRWRYKAWPRAWPAT